MPRNPPITFQSNDFPSADRKSDSVFTRKYIRSLFRADRVVLLILKADNLGMMNASLVIHSIKCGILDTIQHPNFRIVPIVFETHVCFEVYFISGSCSGSPG